jgi:hypothetical protein
VLETRARIDISRRAGVTTHRGFVAHARIEHVRTRARVVRRSRVARDVGVGVGGCAREE